MDRLKTLALVLVLGLAATATGAQIDMDVAIDTIADGTTDGQIDLDVVLDAVVIDAPDAIVKIQLWGQDKAGAWYRVSPAAELSTLAGETLPASPGAWHEFRGVWVWPAAGNVSRIVYDRTLATAIYINGRRAAKQ